MESDSKPLVSIFIDGQEVRVPAGTNIIEAAASAGIEIPHYCYHEHLSVPGNCRMCLTEMGMEMKDRATGEPIMDENGKAKIGWIPRPQIACATKAAAGQHFKTQSPMVKEARNAVSEFMLINHPLDCPICDQAGECKLQEFAADHGKGESRFEENKNVKPKHKPIGPRVMLDDERCILCSRCIRFSKEVAKEDVLGFIDRGSYTTLTTFPGRELDHNYSLNTVDICPVGALTSTDFRFQMRVWFLKKTSSICTESSVGVNTTVWTREGKIYRVTPRTNNAVNDSWMSDSGRALYKQVDAENRITKGTENSAERMYQQLLKTRGQIAVVTSAHQSLEEHFLLKRLVKQLEAIRVDMIPHVGEGDGLLISADRTPNMRGALLTGLIDSYPTGTLDGLKADIKAGKVKTLVVIREDVIAAGLTPEDLEGVTLIHLDSHSNKTTALAEIVQPVLSVFERSGSFVNQQWRVQRFNQVVPGPEGVPTDIALVDKLFSHLGQMAMPAPTPEAVWKLMAPSILPLQGLSFASLGEEGVQIDGSAFDSINFPEGETLHYKP